MHFGARIIEKEKINRMIGAAQARTCKELQLGKIDQRDFDIKIDTFNEVKKLLRK